MIFYFSGTGNSAWAARQLARLTGDEARDITTLSEPPRLPAGQTVGFVFPVYAWGPAEPITLFARKLPPTDGFTFGVCTCGGDAGHALKRFSRTYPLDSSYSLILPNNYIVGTDTEDPSSILRKLDAARGQLAQMAREITRKERVCRVQEGALGGLKSSLANYGFNHFARSAKPFRATDACNGCGLCARNCPAGAISLTEKEPVWKDQCFQCMRCINLCPQQAIQYGKGTEGRRRYVLEQYLPPEERTP